MAEWLKNICLSPFKYGIDKANLIAIKTISMIFNLYGSRLLKMDIDKIIKSNECIGDNDIFYIYPLLLKELEQELGLNIIKIDEGIINGLVISVPWKTMLIDATQINVSDISIKISFVQNENSIHISSLENTNSYFSDKQLDNNDNDLLQTYKEIRDLLLQYFNKINCKIGSLEIILSQHFKIMVKNIEYFNNTITIENVTIYAEKEDTKMASVSELVYNIEKNHLFIQELDINPQLVDFLPEYYTENEQFVFSFNISVALFTMNELNIKDLWLTITDKNISIQSLASININNILFLKCEQESFNLTATEEPRAILIYDKKTNNIHLNKILCLKIGNINEFFLWTNNVRNLVNKFADKIIVIDLDENSGQLCASHLDSDSNLIINNASATIIYGDDIFNISFSKIFLAKENILTNIEIDYNNVRGEFGMIKFYSSLPPEKEGNIFEFVDSIITSNNFKLVSKMSLITKKTDSVTILFDTTNANNIAQLVEFVTGIIDKFTPHDNTTNNKSAFVEKRNSIQSIEIDLLDSTNDLSATLALIKEDENLDNNEQNPYMVNLELQNCCMYIDHEKTNFELIVDHCDICVTTKNATNISANILMDGYLIARIDATEISANYNLIESLKIFIDPENFDKINYLLGTLSSDPTSVSNEEIDVPEEFHEQLENTLSKSIISSSLTDLENKITLQTNIIKNSLVCNEIEDIVSFPFLKILEKSCTDLRKVLIDDYQTKNPEIESQSSEIFVKSFQIYLFDELTNYYSPTKSPTAFLCAIFKEIEFKKIIVKIKDEKERKNKFKTKYTFNIKTGAIIDTCCNNPEWKYFVKFCNGNVLAANVSFFENVFRININVHPIKTNIREETLLRLLAFFSNSHHTPKNSDPVLIGRFMISPINILVNYYPIILKDTGMEVLTLKDFKLVLSSQILENVEGLDKLLDIMGTKWKEEVNPENIFQFLPNVKIIQPYAEPLMNFISVITKYFKNSQNKKTIRNLTKNISQGTSLVASMIKNGIGHVWELFH